MVGESEADVGRYARGMAMGRTSRECQTGRKMNGNKLEIEAGASSAFKWSGSWKGPSLAWQQEAVTLSTSSFLEVQALQARCFPIHSDADQPAA